MYEANKPIVEDTTPVVNKLQVVDEKPKKKFKWGKFVGFILLGLFLTGAGYIGYRFYMFKPYRVFVTNVTSRSATISWVTESSESGMVLFRENKAILPIWISPYGMGKGYDDRDYSNAELETAEGNVDASDIKTEVVVTDLGFYYTHHITIKDLNPESNYAFLIGDGFIFKQSADIEKFTTYTDPKTIVTPKPTYGIIQYWDEESDLFSRATEAVIYGALTEELTKTESEKISCITNSYGGWYLDVSGIKTSNGEDFFDIIAESEATNITISLVIENVWLGRWSKDIRYTNSFPAETILTGVGEGANTTYDGVFNEQSEERIFGLLITNVFAKDPDGGGYAEKKVQAAKSQAKTAYINAAQQARNWAQPTKQADIAKAPEIQKATKEIRDIAATTIKIANSEDTDDNKLSKIKTEAKKNESTLNNAVSTAFGNSSSHTGNASGSSSSSSSGSPVANTVVVEEPEFVGEDSEAHGSCGNDNKCSSGGQCGWVDTAACSCSCGSSDPLPMGPGQSCSCDTSNNPVVAGVIAEALSERSTASSRKVVCPNNTGILDEDDNGYCYSSGGNCWYGEEYKTELGPSAGIICKKLDDGTAQWGDTGYTVEDYKVEIKPPELEDELVVIKGDYNEDGVVDIDDLIIKYKMKTYGGLDEKPDLPGVKTDGASEEAKLHCNKVANMFGVSSEGDAIKCALDNTWRLTTTREASELDPDKPCTHYGEVLYRYGLLYKCGDGEVSNIPGGSGVYTMEKPEYNWVSMTRIEAEEYATSFEEGWTYNDGPCTADQCNCRSVTFENSTVNIVDGLVGNGVSCPQSNTLDYKTDVLAAETGVQANNQFIFDPKTETFSGFETGVYSFEYQGDTFLIDISEFEKVFTDGKFALYVDLDKDGNIDKTKEKITDESILLNVKTIVKGSTYLLRKGFNFVSFPFVFDDTSISMASYLLADLNTKYGNIFLSISKYNSGKWQIVGANGGNYNQNDFQILPGQGYVLKTSADTVITIYGHEITYESTTDSAPIRFMPGWNLVGLYGTSVRSYTAESLLQDITNYEPVDFTAVNVSRWQENRALYEALQRDEDSTVYGLDFPIELKRSYFVKVTKGDGNWEPGIR